MRRHVLRGDGPVGGLLGCREPRPVVLLLPSKHALMMTARPPVARRSRGLGAAVGAVGVVAFVEAFMLSRHPAWFQKLDGWFYFPLARPLGPPSAKTGISSGA